MPWYVNDEQVDEAAEYLQSICPTRPGVGVILGTGLGGFADVIDVERLWPYDQVPHFLKSTAVGQVGASGLWRPKIGPDSLRLRPISSKAL